MAVLNAAGATFDTEVPVVVVGAGACGCLAALAAQERGAEVVVFERDKTPRGNTALSGGQILAGGSRLQAAAGIPDSGEILAADLLRKAQNQCDEGIARHVAKESAATINWLVEKHGLPLSCVDSFLYAGFTQPHMHATPTRSGAELLDELMGAMNRAGIEIVTSARVADLYADEDGAIRGVGIERPDGQRETVGCQALILACNGFGGNKALLRKYMPEIADAHYHGHAGNQGDAVLWGEALGASLKDLTAFQGHGSVCTPHMIHLGWAVFGDGGFQVNTAGRRFSHETQGYSEQALRILRQPSGIAWAIWDRRCDAIANEIDNHRQARAAGAIRDCATVEEMAAIIGCDAATLRQTVEDVAAMARGEKACPFGRDFTAFPPLAAPYCCARLTGALFHTQGGLEVDTTGRVLRPDGSRFPNLFAGGGAARGLSGPSDWGYLSGSGLLMATTLGRLAGEAAAELVGKGR